MGDRLMPNPLLQRLSFPSVRPRRSCAALQRELHAVVIPWRLPQWEKNLPLKSHAREVLATPHTRHLNLALGVTLFVG
jgi:hypothetical protein